MNPQQNEINKYISLVISMSYDFQMGVIDLKTYTSNLILIAEQMKKLYEPAAKG